MVWFRMENNNTDWEGRGLREGGGERNEREAAQRETGPLDALVAVATRDNLTTTGKGGRRWRGKIQGLGAMATGSRFPYGVPRGWFEWGALPGWQLCPL